MRMRNKPNLAARMDRCAHLLAAEPEQLRGKWLDTHGGSELHIEIGCGKGAFTMETAKASPDVLYAAIEKSANVMITAMERAESEGLRNIRFISTPADRMSDIFAPGEVSRIYINFCDPWPLNRHIKRRLTHHNYLELYKQLLRPGGEIHFKTDNLPLFEYSLQEFRLCGYTPASIIYDLHKDGPVGIMTDYERKFHARGLPIYYAAFV